MLFAGQMPFIVAELDAEQAESLGARESIMHVTTLVAPPTALHSDRSGRLLVCAPGDQGGLFVVDAERGETRRFIAGSVSGVSGSRDGKLFVATGGAILQVDLEAGWTVTDVSADFGCWGQGGHTVAGNRDGSVWISGCVNFRESNGEFLPQPEGIGDGEAPVASAYDLYDNHWALASAGGGSTVVAVRSASRPEAWQVVDPQPDGLCRLLTIDATGFVWVADGEIAGVLRTGVLRMNPHQPDDGWHTPVGVADWCGRVTAMTRSHAEGDVLDGFGDGALLEVDADSANVLSSRTLLSAGERGSIDLIHVDGLGNIWLASGSHIYRIEAADKAWQRSWEETTPMPGGNHDIFAVVHARQMYVAGGLTAGWSFPAVSSMISSTSSALKVPSPTTLQPLSGTNCRNPDTCHKPRT